MYEKCVFDVLIYFQNDHMESKEQYIVYLFALLRKYHIYNLTDLNNNTKTIQIFIKSQKNN